MTISIIPHHLPKPDDRRSITGYGQTRLSSTVYRTKPQHRVTSNRRHLHPRPTVIHTTTLVQSSDPRQTTAIEAAVNVNSP